MPKIEFFNEDNMVLMGRYPDKHFDLAIVDPEFGIGIAKSGRLVKDKGFLVKNWDDKPIDEKYFDELFRVSKSQIIWGGNYYALPPCKHCIVWDKKQPEGMSFGMFDYAWTSFDGANKMFRFSATNVKCDFHPTAKPIQLYEWLLKRYAKEGDKILDTHGGSFNHAIACHNLGFDLVITEIDKDYFNKAKKRFDIHASQTIADFS